MTAKVLKTKWGTARVNSHGYYVITSRKEGYHHKKLHRLIYEAYYGKIPEGYHIHHRDFDKLNNHHDNLQLLTVSEHLSLHHSYKILSQETKDKISDSKTGIPLSDEHKQKLSESHKGQTPWNKGKSGCYSDETIQKLSEASSGENNPRAKYNSFWDINYVVYFKNSMLRNNGGYKPKKVFLSKYKGYRLPIGYFFDFTTPEIIGELIEEYI